MAVPYLLSAAARRLEGKVALITGGASGIGACTARLFCKHGAKVVLADIQDATSLCNEIGSTVASYLHCDVSNEDDVKKVVDKAVSDHGNLDIMFNNAGVIDTCTPIMDADLSEFARLMSINFNGVLFGIKHAARVMVPTRRGSIVNTTSVAAVMAGISSHAYTSSKHAVVGLTRNAAVELGEAGVRVNCVSPYGLATPLSTKATKMETEEFENVMESGSALKGVKLNVHDVANAVLYLASDESRYVNGHNLVIDGGFTISRGSDSFPKH